jgi:hypothetical protein
MSQQVMRSPQHDARTSPRLGARSSPEPTGPADEHTYDQLYEEARKRGLKGRSKMSKTELERALAL